MNKIYLFIVLGIPVLAALYRVGIFDFDQDYLSEPPVQAYERYLDTIETMTSFSDIEHILHSSIRSKYYRAYEEGSVEYIRKEHDLSAMEYVEYTGSGVFSKFIYIGLPSGQADVSSSAENASLENLTGCAVEMFHNGSEWQLMAEVCYSMAEMPLVKSNRDKLLKIYYKRREEKNKE